MRRLLAVAALMCAAGPLWSGESSSAMLRYLDSEILSWSNDARLRDALGGGAAANAAQALLQARLVASGGRIAALSLQDLSGNSPSVDGMAVQQVRADGGALLPGQLAPWGFELSPAFGCADRDPGLDARPRAIFALTDPQSGQVIGTLTVELNRAGFF